VDPYADCTPAGTRVVLEEEKRDDLNNEEVRDSRTMTVISLRYNENGASHLIELVLFSGYIRAFSWNS